MEVYKIPPITVVAGHGQISISFFSTCFTKSLETVVREAGERKKREKEDSVVKWPVMGREGMPCWLL